MVSFWRSPDNTLTPYRDDEESGGEGLFKQRPISGFFASLQNDSPVDEVK
jgi:hypothetical protein